MFYLDRPFSRLSGACNWNLIKILFALILIPITQSGHNFAHVMTAKLSWHAQNCDLIKSLFFTQKPNAFSQELDSVLYDKPSGAICARTHPMAGHQEAFIQVITGRQSYVLIDTFKHWLLSRWPVNLFNGCWPTRRWHIHHGLVNVDRILISLLLLNHA